MLVPSVSDEGSSGSDIDTDVVMTSSEWVTWLEGMSTPCASPSETGVGKHYSTSEEVRVAGVEDMDEGQDSDQHIVR